MTKIATLKAQATNLRASLDKAGVTLSHAQALEAVAGQYGFETWDSLAGVLNKKAITPTPLLADMPGYPSGVWVEQGQRREYCSIGYYDAEAIALLTQEVKLHEFIAEHAELFEAGMNSMALLAESDGVNFEFSLNHLLGMTYQVLGGQGTWLLADGLTYLQFECGGAWTPAQAKVLEGPADLVVPEMAKSAKGCQLIVLNSSDGDKWNCHVIVPPRLKARDIADKIDIELRRLKNLDKETAAEPENEYTSAALAAFVSALGCTWVNDKVVTAETWD